MWGRGRRLRKVNLFFFFFIVEEVCLGTPVVAALGVINTRGRGSTANLSYMSEFKAGGSVR